MAIFRSGLALPPRCSALQALQSVRRDAVQNSAEVRPRQPPLTAPRRASGSSRPHVFTPCSGIASNVRYSHLPRTEQVKVDSLIETHWLQVRVEPLLPTMPAATPQRRNTPSTLPLALYLFTLALFVWPFCQVDDGMLVLGVRGLAELPGALPVPQCAVCMQAVVGTVRVSTSFIHAGIESC